jgi:hypothetical protein
MSEELKLCPYCGGLVKVAPHQGKAETEKLLMCCTNKRCPNEGNLFYFDEWQSRPLEDALQAKLDIVRELYSEAKQILEQIEGECDVMGIAKAGLGTLAEIERIKKE